MPSSCAARLMRSAISPRLAISTFFTAIDSALDREQRLAVIDRLAVGDVARRRRGRRRASEPGCGCRAFRRRRARGRRRGAPPRRPTGRARWRMPTTSERTSDGFGPTVRVAVAATAGRKPGRPSRWRRCGALGAAAPRRTSISTSPSTTAAARATRLRKRSRHREPVARARPAGSPDRSPSTWLPTVRGAGRGLRRVAMARPRRAPPA